MNTPLFFKKWLVGGIAAIALLACVALPQAASAGTNHNLAGWAWSSNIGWVKLNNCTNPLDAATCAGTSFGVNLDLGTGGAGGPGTLTGYGWSPNIGWIRFGGNSGFPSTPTVSAVNARLAAGTTGIVSRFEGWIRALAGTNPSAGTWNGWDGWIAMSSTIAPAYGVTLVPQVSGAGSAAVVQGFAWGSSVVGWLSFDAVIYDENLVFACTDPNATNYNSSPTVVNDPSLCTYGDICPNIAGNQTTIPVGVQIDANGDCITVPTDLCLNISGVQTTIPQGLVSDGFGNCIEPRDLCPNISGMQLIVPPGFSIDPVTGDCKEGGGGSGGPIDPIYREN